MSEEQVADLRLLDPARFDPGEYAALRWVRALLTEPGGVPADIQEQFEANLDERERTLVKASMKGMFCVNLWVNTVGLPGARPAGSTPAVCPIRLTPP